ncbi:transmembrane protein 25 [Rhinatrema bivittatum]|uniref:transmembrane protein 25 n=1 Tax=Rhinatrema bivittatum TaxID=194408 RepID=UPI00112D3E7F|nr:transmembrane protein 25 [Rhinatrema bivittatum]XP_029429604.1 transmembrane protein 25 [Rhinatrema bivittatum]
MNLPKCWAGISPALLVLLLPPGLGEPESQIKDRALLVSPLQEGKRQEFILQEGKKQKFRCRADGWKSLPMLTWYLNGEKQENNDSVLISTSGQMFKDSNSTFTVTAHRSDRELNCSILDPVFGRESNASILLNVQFKPEIMEMSARYQERQEPGIFLVLFVLIQANPPASITWVDQDGQLMVNTSDFLLLDTKSYPWLTNHTVQVQLSSAARNFSFSTANNIGVTHSSIPAPGLLYSRVELPVLGIIVGGALGVSSIFLLNVLILCLVFRKQRKKSGVSGLQLMPSDSNNLKLNHVRMPRENMSLPSNMQLNDLSQSTKGRPIGANIQMNYSEEELSEPQSSEMQNNKGFSRFPTVGYIYKVSSMSSDEIWL